MHINCALCKHYFVTWDQNLRHGCLKYQSKSKQYPALIVKQETGEPCFSYEPKTSKKAQDSDDLDLNRDDIW